MNMQKCEQCSGNLDYTGADWFCPQCDGPEVLQCAFSMEAGDAGECVIEGYRGECASLDVMVGSLPVFSMSAKDARYLRDYLTAWLEKTKL